MIKPQPVIRCVLRLVPVIMAMATLSACSPDQTSKLQKVKTENHTITVDDHRRLLLKAPEYEFITIVRNIHIRARILEQYASWKGVRYSFGGNSKRGVDCSAFVQLTFREQFGMHLPRSTSGQQSVGKKVQRTKLLAGDLVLFQSGPTGRHVGIYLSNNQFVHASTHNGVMVSNLNDVYWNKRFYVARRVLSVETNNTAYINS